MLKYKGRFNLQKQIMKQFEIEEVLLYNPNLKSKKKKPIESDIQQAKIMAFYPNSSPIQQKCNSVGMAQGVYAFCDSLLPEQLRTPCPQTIFMDQCCLVQKQVQQNIWIFMKLAFDPDTKYKQKQSKQQQDIPIQSGYINSSFTQQILESFINHFYQSFKIFYGKISGYLFLENLFQLQKIVDYFVPKYQAINSYPRKQHKLDILSYLVDTIRAVPLDVNTTLKFDYFKNVLQRQEPEIIDIMVFSNGFLAYSSLDKKITEFFERYLFGCIEPFKFDQEKLSHRFNNLSELPSFNSLQKYGSLFNSILFGFQQENLKPHNNDARSSLIATSSIKSDMSQDLLGIQEKEQIELIDVYLTKNEEELKCKINIFIEKNMVFITFYREISAIKQLIFANRFYHDNSHKFSVKINETLSNMQNQSDLYRFLFVNQSTFVGKCTFKDWNLVGNQIKYTLQKVKGSKQGQICTTFQNHWVYGIKRMNRVLILLVPNEIPLHKIEQFASKMTKQYFYKCFM